MDFLTRYAFGQDNPDSTYSNLIRAYNNAIVLREEIGSEALAYVQLSVYALQKAAVNESPLIELQKILDNLLAFWGSIDDTVENEHIRNLIKYGKRIERLDLYSRLEMPAHLMRKEENRLAHRIKITGIRYDEVSLGNLEALIYSDTIDYDKVVMVIEKLAI